MLYDITPPVVAAPADAGGASAGGAGPGGAMDVFPGDTPPSRQVLLDLARGDAVSLSTLRSTVHVGAHADGENHYLRGGRPIDEMPLDRFLGPCRVVTARVQRAPGGLRVRADDLSVAPERIGAQRVLIRTGTQPDKAVFNNDFAGLEPVLIDALASRGVITIGVDTPSVDVAESKDLPAHGACARSGVAILEGLALDGVPDGEYELIALPLKLVGFDASPVRAVLRTPNGR